MNTNETNIHEEDEISLVDLLNILKKHIKLIIGVFLVIGILGSIVGALKYKNGKVDQTIISYNFNDINKGENPNGTEFDYNEITSAAVLSMVENELQLANYGITRGDLLTSITIDPIIPAYMSTKIENNLKDGVSTEYTASNYKISIKLLKNKELTHKILISLVKNYTNYYKENYKLTTKLGKIDDLSDLGYLEIEKVLKNKSKEIRNKINQQPNQGYTSKVTGLGFSDILSELNQYDQISLSRLDRMISLDGISKDKETDIAEIEHDIFKLELSKSKEEANVRAIEKVLTNFKLTPSTVLSGDENQNTVSGDNSNIKTYSKLTEQLVTTQDNIAEIVNQIKELEVKEAKIKTSETSKLSKEFVTNLVSKISSIIEDANKTLEDYNNQFISEYVSQTSPVKTVNVSKGLLIILGSLVLGLILGILLAFVKEFLEVAKLEGKNQNQKRIK